MNSYTRTIEVINNLTNGFKADFADLKNARKAEVDAIDVTSVEKSAGIIATLRDQLCIVARGVQVDGISVSKFATSYKIIENSKGGIDTIEFTVKSQMRAKHPFSYTSTIEGTSDIFDGMAETFVTALIELYKIDIAGENVDELNAILDAVFEENEITAKFNFALNNSKYITEITNDCVTFGVSVDKALEINTLEIARCGNEWEDKCRNFEIEKIVSATKAAGTTVKLVKSNIEIISILTEVKSKKRADSLIRKSYSKKAIHLTAKGGVGYVEKDVKIDGEDVSIFALVAKDAEGNMSVVLNPFNINTLFNVEYDVLADLK